MILKSGKVGQEMESERRYDESRVQCDVIIIFEDGRQPQDEGMQAASRS